MSKLIIVCVLIAACSAGTEIQPETDNDDPSADDCGMPPTKEFYAPPTMSVDAAGVPIVLLYQKDYDGELNYQANLLSWALCERARY